MPVSPLPYAEAHLPADDILHALVIDGNGQISALVEPAERGVGRVGAP